MSYVNAASKQYRVLGDRYEILGSIGAGAAANVFRVRDARTGAVRAAKVLKTELASNPDTLARFEDEFRILRTLHHPHLPEVYDYGRVEDGGRFLVMELVEGEPLDRHFAAHPEDIWVILYEICETLVFVHGRNLLHQDIKPSNILVSRAARTDGARPMIKLIDFGLTYRRGTGAAVKLVGTAEYIAPEVVRGESTLTRAVDYYSLGATLFELLSGAPPFVGTESEVLRAHLERQPVIEQEELEWAELYPHVRALLAKDAQARLVAFEEFRRAVVGRLTGGIEDLDRAYALARIDSLDAIGKQGAWDELMGWLRAIDPPDAVAPTHTVSVAGGEGFGKRYLLDALRAEAAVRGIRTLAPAEIDARSADVTAARQPTLIWSRLLAMCEQEAVILVVDRPASLPDEERSFVRLAGTQWELMRSRGRVLPLFFVIAVDTTTADADVLDYLPTDGALAVELHALSRADRDDIVAQFRGSMFDSRDARALATYLGRFEDAGSAIQGLQQAVLRSALTFVGQRWKVQPSLLTEIVTTRADESFSRDLVGSLSKTAQQVAALVAAHPAAVPVTWAAEFADLGADEIPSITGGSLKRLCLLSSGLISPATTAIRATLSAGSESSLMHRAHRFLVLKLVTGERGVSEDRALAYHHERLGSVRDAARVHLRLLQAYWSVRPRERPYELIEGVCRSGLELLEAHGGTVAATTRRHLFCFYLKQWINALWARNLFTHAKRIVDEWTAKLGETMPASVAPRYVRSVLELDGPVAALRAVDDTRRVFPIVGRQLASRLELETSLFLHQRGDYRTALDVLERIPSSELSLRDEYRLEIYRAMHVIEIEGADRAIATLRRLMEPAAAAGCIDESMLMRGLVARALLERGETNAGLSVAAAALRLANTFALSYRANLMYRLASGAYVELGDLTRARHCQESAIQLAETVGVRDIAAVSWARLAAIERMAGRYGNARQYFNRAISLLGDSGQTWIRVTTHVGLYGTLVLMRNAESVLKEKELNRSLIKLASPVDMGFFYGWKGLDRELNGNEDAALKEYERAQECFRRVGHNSNLAWAIAREVRARMAKADLEHASSRLADLEEVVRRAASREAEFELAILRLEFAYLARVPRADLSRLAGEVRCSLGFEQHAYLRVEALRLLLRVRARCGKVLAASEAFEELRELVLEITSNMDAEDGRAFADSIGLGDSIIEYGLLQRSGQG